jgi:serine/threonine protein kinase
MRVDRRQVIEITVPRSHGRAGCCRKSVKVGLKLLVERDEAMVARFVREGRLLAELSHPRIVRYVGHGAASARVCWLALEWLDGEDLAARLRRGGLTLGEVLTVARRTAEALAYTHARGVVHRDIKPSNLFLPDEMSTA